MKDKITPYILIAPTMILFTLFFLTPLLYSFSLSFVEWNGFSVDRIFVGLDNYLRLFQDEGFLNALKNTLIYAGVTVPLSVFLSLIMSAILDDKTKGFQTLKGIYFLPHIVSLVAVGVVWSWIFLPDKYGLLNVILGFFGIDIQRWFFDPKLAMPSLIIIGIWKSMGYNMVIFIAGLLSIPKSLYEAATIDGAKPHQSFWYVTLPMLKPTIFFVMVSSTIYSLFQIFDIVNVTTKGGPIGKTEMLVTYLYKTGFKDYEMGYASAIAFVLFAIAVTVTIIQRKFVEEK